MDGKTYPYGKRGLPYVEDPSHYHQYEITSDLHNIKDYYNRCTDSRVKTEIDKLMKRRNLSWEDMVPQKGEIAHAFGKRNGGGIQIQMPLDMKTLEKLGLVKEITL